MNMENSSKVLTHPYQVRVCPKCVGNNLSQDEWYQSSILIYSDKYDYSKVDLISQSKRVVIICLKHGELEQAPYSHSIGAGYLRCGSINSSLSNKDPNTPAILYYILGFNDKDQFVKIEVTTVSIYDRFKLWKRDG